MTITYVQHALNQSPSSFPTLVIFRFLIIFINYFSLLMFFYRICFINFNNSSYLQPFFYILYVKHLRKSDINV